MKVRAYLSRSRISPRKVAIVLDQIRNRPAAAALVVLDNLTKRGAKIVKKLLQSAIANAVNNSGLETESLMIAEAYVTQGPTLKRFQARAHGRAFPILKRTSHITIVLDDNK